MEQEKKMTLEEYQKRHVMKLSKNQQIIFDVIKDNEPITEQGIKQLVKLIDPSIKSIKTKILDPLLRTKQAITFDGTSYRVNPSFTAAIRTASRGAGGVTAPGRAHLSFSPRIPFFTAPVTIYEFAHEYLILQTETLHGVPRADAIRIVDMYLRPNVRPPYTYEALLEETVQSFQTASRNINVINYLANKSDLDRALFHYDLSRITSSSVPVLLSRCSSIIGAAVTRSSKTWEKMLECLKDNAAIMSRFPTAIDYHAFLDKTVFSRACGCNFIEYQSKSNKRRASLNPTDYGVKGFGPAITPNYLKEIGYMYGKPDTHLISVASYVPGWLPSVAPTLVWSGTITSTIKAEFETGLSDQVAKARAAGFTSVDEYVLDKILWLICSGFYYKHRNSRYGGGAKRLKEPFIVALDHAIKTGVVIP